MADVRDDPRADCDFNGVPRFEKFEKFFWFLDYVEAYQE